MMASEPATDGLEAPECRWLSGRALLLLHEMCLAEFGGRRGVRDVGVFETVLAMPAHMLAENEDLSLAELAAAYAMGLIRMRPLNDGNEQAAFLAMVLFAELNGYVLAVDQAEAVLTMWMVAGGEVEEAGLVAWIGDHLQ